VTLFTGNLTVDMPLVIEDHMLGQIIDLYPWRRCLSVEIAVLYLNPGMLGDDVIVAMEAFFNRGKARKVGVGHIRMTVLTLNLFDAAVHIMAEWDRLLRTDSQRWGFEEKIDKGPCEYEDNQRQNYNCRISAQRL
jgi:hypothetical protein